MQVRCGEGEAIHTDPESCGAAREGVCEALIGARAGQPLSGENFLQGADALEVAEGNMDGRAIASARPTLRRLRPWHARTSPAREPGDLPLDRLGHSPPVRIGKAKSRSR